jgi:hypothetical protein
MLLEQTPGDLLLDHGGVLGIVADGLFLDEAKHEGWWSEGGSMGKRVLRMCCAVGMHGMGEDGVGEFTPSRIVRAWVCLGGDGACVV